MNARIIIVGLLVGAVLLPSVSFAQVATERDVLMQQLVAVLMQQIQLLQSQLKALQEKTSSDPVTLITSPEFEEDEKLVEEKSDSEENLKIQNEIIKRLKAIDSECSPSGCDYGLRYEQEWNQLIEELKKVEGTYEGSCLFGLVGNQNAISPGNRHLTWRCVGWGG